jgi:ectoine hydroxylase
MGKLSALLRSYKLSYTIYNFFNKKKLTHNKNAYKAFGVKKLLHENISSNDFAHMPKGNVPWIDLETETFNQQLERLQLPNPIKEQVLQFRQHGFLHLHNFLQQEEVQQINTEIETLLKTNEVQYNAAHKIMFANQKSTFIENITKKEALVNLLSTLLGKQVIPFQTINFIKGSAQKAHSDSIHMTTYPEGYLIAVWIPLEPTDANNGPLFYYEGSHTLPYLLEKDLQLNAGNRIHDDAYAKYEMAIETLVQQKQLQPKELHAQPGDIFIWHANLLHGGAPIIDHNRTRKSMVIHYFGEGVVKYHDITQRPALIN